MLICLERKVTRDCLRGLIELNPERVVCLDVAFDGNDQLKTNQLLEMRSHGIEFRTI
jgi:adenine-specific DNA-methyltransferase